MKLYRKRNSAYKFSIEGISQDMPPKLLKNSTSFCSETLKQIFHDTEIYLWVSKQTGKSWSYTHVPTKAENYKPVSVVTVVLKEICFFRE